MKNQCVATAAIFAAAVCGAQTFDINGYCGEMASRQSLGSAWRESCISALEVQQKYLEKYRQEQQRNARIDRRIAQGNWFIEMMKLQNLQEKAAPDDQPLLNAQVDQLMAQCRSLLDKPSDCDELQREIDARRRK